MTWSQVGRRPPDKFPLVQLVVVNALILGLFLWFAGWDPFFFTLMMVFNVLPIFSDWWEHRKKAADPFGGLMR